MNLELNRERNEMEFKGFCNKQNSTDIFSNVEIIFYLELSKQTFDFKMFQRILIKSGHKMFLGIVSKSNIK
jgi:hypothetical protein